MWQTILRHKDLVLFKQPPGAGPGRQCALRVKRRFSVPAAPGSAGLLRAGFQSLVFGGLGSQVKVLQVEVPGVGTKFSLFRGKFQVCEYPLDTPTCESPRQGWGFWRDCVSASPARLDVALPSFAEAKQLLCGVSGLSQRKLLFLLSLRI